MSRLLLCLVFVVCFSLATVMDNHFQQVRQESNRSSSVLAVVMGDSRQMFANHFFAKADAYFHDGKYPSIFDLTLTNNAVPHMSSQAQEAHEEDEHDHHEGEEHGKEDGYGFMGPPRDWIEAFGRHFMYTEHSHLGGAKNTEREILPWLKLSAEMDPHRVNTYVTTAYWLRKRLHKSEQAEEFLREGLRNNPDSCEILLELGKIYGEDRKEYERGVNLCEMALAKWIQFEAPKQKPDEMVHLQILGALVELEERQGHIDRLLHYLVELKKISPNPDSIEKQIQETKAKLPTASR